jgi:hypothetical protein
MASLTNSATLAADAIPAPKLVGCIDEAIAATSNIVLRGCAAADHACFGLTLLDVPKKCDLFLGRGQFRVPRTVRRQFIFRSPTVYNLRERPDGR